MKISYKSLPVASCNLMSRNITFTSESLTLWDSVDPKKGQNVSYQISPSGIETEMSFMQAFWTFRAWSISIAHK